MILPHFRHSSLSSTSTEAQRLISQGELPPFAVSAETQTQGRGRMGRDWSSPKGNIYLTLALAPCSLAELEHVPCLTALLVARWLESEFGFSPTIKWPNDLLHKGKKFCGILCESSWNGQEAGPLLVGIGLNVRMSSSAGCWTSLEDILGRVPEGDLISCLLEFWDREWPLLSLTKSLAEYESRHIARDQLWRCKESGQLFKLRGFTPQAHMMLSPLAGGASFSVISAHNRYSWIYQIQDTDDVPAPLFVAESGPGFFHLAYFPDPHGTPFVETFQRADWETWRQSSFFWRTEIPARPWPIYVNNLALPPGELDWIQNLVPGAELQLVRKKNISSESLDIEALRSLVLS